ncbi:patatin-like phospholipase family protein [Streptomyces sp. NPDC056519]|uniref:patatin-like phospholipase family protein n=1 Tax=Streptomyces sp. NPDC056519 TaxID=3345849 RepID=UPI0036800CF6
MSPGLLVLGAGGPVGLAWQLGWLEQAPDVLGTGVPVIGTSAGAMAGALLLLGPERRRAVADALRAAARQAAAPAEAEGGAVRGASRPDPELRATTTAAYEGGPRAVRALGELMSAHPDDGAHIEEVRRMVGEEWPAGALTVVARNASTGARKLFRAGAVPLHLAVAASSAAPGRTTPVTVGGERYIDGGIGSLLNSDLARGTAGPVWILAPAGLGTFSPAIVPALMRNEVTALETSGTRVELFTPREVFADLGAFADIARAMDDGARVARDRFDQGC